MGGATEEPMGGEGEGTNEPTGGEPTAPTRPMGTGEPTGEDTMVVTYKPMEEDPVEELTSWPTQKPTINDIGEGTDSPTGGLIEEPPRDGLGMDLFGQYNNQPQDRGGGTVVGTVATTTKTVGMAPPPTMDCGATLVDDRSD